MEEHLKNRPNKKRFSTELIDSLRNRAIKYIESKFLPDEKIIKIVLIGSSLKDSFGEYEPPGFRGSLFSDFDFIIFIEDDYSIPGWLEKNPTAKPFPDDGLNLTFRNKKVIDKKYDIEILFIKKKSIKEPRIQKSGELAGIPMIAESKHKNLVVYP